MSQDLITEVKIELAKRNKSKAWLARKLGISKVYLGDILDGKKRAAPQVEPIKIVLADLKAGRYDKEDA
ncbi:XRE family transcriptional regulator [Enterococcus asini]|uniref:XRE family transcriptional regulator n=1 Tax=Enterococcus asini TaxID=57732 RepID=UPI002890708D|nr:XRE family transcriptional regulator [Enterococcus asini]MDT2757312.1 XRE family transcriptional regulator [Enterococcus asini]